MPKEITKTQSYHEPKTVEEHLTAAETTSLKNTWNLAFKSLCAKQIQNLLGDNLPKKVETNKRLEKLFRELGQNDLANKYEGFVSYIESLPAIEKKPNFLSVSNVKASIAANQPKQI